MIAITLKLLLALVLTSVPFIFNLWVKPRQKESGRWHSFVSLMASLLPFFLTLKRRAFVFFMRICRRMKISDNARKFFIYSVIVVLLLVQATDYASSLSVQSIHSMLWTDGAVQENWHGLGIMVGETVIHNCRSCHVPVLLYSALIIMTVVLLSSYKMADAALLSLKSNALFCWLGVAAVLLVFVGYGQYAVVSECMLVMMMASTVYPKKINIRLCGIK